MTPAQNYSRTDVAAASDGLVRDNPLVNDRYQLQEESDITTSDEANWALTYEWALTDFGQVGERSRDGSIHATDEGKQDVLKVYQRCIHHNTYSAP